MPLHQVRHHQQYYQLIKIVLLVSVGLALALTFFTVVSSDHRATASTATSQSLQGVTLNDGQSAQGWRLESGGYFSSGGTGSQTVLGNLSSTDPVRLAYASKYPTESDLGFHPQNLFRLFSTTSWKDNTVDTTVQVQATNVYQSANAHPYNGVYLVSQYQDNNNYYYAGVRVDGTAVIKRKVGGTHYVLANAVAFPGTYDPVKNPTLIPQKKSFSLRLTSQAAQNGSVVLTLSINDSGAWRTLVSFTDTGALYHGTPLAAGAVGLTSDFMDLTIGKLIVTSEPVSADTSSSSTATSTSTTSVPTPTTSVPTSPTSGNTQSTSVTPYGLAQNGTITETGTMSESSSPSWWVNSGAYFYIQNGVGRTAAGRLSVSDVWRSLYASANPTDTDQGYVPQNIFRLVTKSTYKNLVQEGVFRINGINMTDSPNRAEHNGFLFFNRYVDGSNLYYTGLRVDGHVVIKKKSKGTYTTLAENTVFPGAYNRSSNPTLIPKNQWIGLRSQIEDVGTGKVRIRVYMDEKNTGAWKLIADTTDDGTRGGAAITQKAYAGIRTDFMDVEFKNYGIKEQ